MVCGNLFILIRYNVGFFLRTHNHLNGSILDLLLCDCLFTVTHSKQRRLVKQVGKIRSRKARGGFCDGGKVNIGTERFAS